MIKTGLCGAAGRMCQAIIKQSLNFPQCVITEKFTKENNLTELDRICRNSDVVIDFSAPELLEPLLDKALQHNTRLVIGTTGFTQKHFSLMQAASKNLSLLYSANMSIGANLIALLGAKVAGILDDSYDIEIVESHHRNKKDSPSGTALMIGRELASARNFDFEKAAVFDRHNNKQKKDNEIGFSSIRGGGMYGEHSILFAGSDETITIKHQVLNRDIFAIGALKAACWIMDKPSGYYSIRSLFSLDI